MLNFTPIESIDFKHLDDVFQKLIFAGASTKKLILKMAIYCLSDAKNLSATNLEMLHAIAASFKVPLSLRKT